MKITTALRRFLPTLEPRNAAQDVLAALALNLAAKLDQGDGGSMTASLARELRATLAALAPAADPVDAELASIMDGLSR